MKHEKSKNDAMRHELDHIDAKILNLLRENARMPLKEIAEHVFLSSPAVSARIERLEKEGYITGYQVKLNPALLGYPIKAFINLEVEPVQISQEKIRPLSPIANAALKDLPPGAAQTSSTRCPGCTPAIRDTKRAAGSCTSSFPSRKGSSVVRSPTPVSSRQPGTHAWGFAVTPHADSSRVNSSAVVFRGLI